MTVSAAAKDKFPVAPEDIVAIVGWNHGKQSRVNRELVGYARAHGLLLEEAEDPKTLVVARTGVFLLGRSTVAIKKRLART